MPTSLSLGELLPAALGIALSPLAVATVILMLFSRRARVNGLAFILGWVCALVLVGGTVLLLGGDAVGSTQSPSTASMLVRVTLGGLLLLVAVRTWRNRPQADQEPAAPTWMSSVESVTPAKSFGIAALMSGPNPKNLALNLAGVVVIAQAGLTTSGTWTAFAIFVVLSSLTVTAPVVYYVIAGRSAEAKLESLKAWIIRNNGTVTGVLALVFGVKLVAEGLQGLIA